MSEFHKGNIQNQILEEEHDHANYAKRVTIVSSATINAVVNAGSGGTSSLDDSAFSVGTDAGTPLMAIYEATPDTVDDGDVGVVGMTANRWQKTKMESAATIYAVVNTSAAGDSVANIGFATVSISNPTLFAVVNTAAAGQASVVLDSSIASIGFATVNVSNTARTITGNVTLSNPNTYIGLTTTTLGRGHQYIGLATVQQVGLVTVVQASTARTITGNITLSPSLNSIGFATVHIGTPTIFAVVNTSATPKTLIPKNFSFAQASVTTIAVPTETFNITSLIANSNATVGLRIKSGATYLIGNVSLSVMLNPGGGWVQHGTPDSPVYKGLAVDQAIVIEKEDFGQVAEISGHLLYFDE